MALVVQHVPVATTRVVCSQARCDHGLRLVARLGRPHGAGPDVGACDLARRVRRAVVCLAVAYRSAGGVVVPYRDDVPLNAGITSVVAMSISGGLILVLNLSVTEVGDGLALVGAVALSCLLVVVCSLSSEDGVLVALRPSPAVERKEP